MSKEETTGWELEVKEVTTAEIDEAVRVYKQARMDYDLAKTVSSEKHAIAEELEMKVLDLLTAAGKTKYTVDNVGTVSVTTRASVATPKTIEEKEQLFAWLEMKFGKEGRVAYQSVHSATLNSLYNSEVAKANERGELFEGIPGLDMPTIVRSISLRK